MAPRSQNTIMSGRRGGNIQFPGPAHSRNGVAARRIEKKIKPVVWKKEKKTSIIELQLGA